jgi:hypothetical protein
VNFKWVNLRARQELEPKAQPHCGGSNDPIRCMYPHVECLYPSPCWNKPQNVIDMILHGGKPFGKLPDRAVAVESAADTFRP